MVDHPHWRPMEVGTDCCDNLTSTEIASEFMESKRRHVERLKRFVSSSRWKVGPGGIHFIRHNRLSIEILPDSGKFRLRIEGRRGKRLFSEIFEARRFVFQVIESGQLNEYMLKRSARRRLSG
ncbi:MAG TPA: hypothetical protein VJ673_13605 [Aromatoleum sp.]|uniref:hypothetical protein n=1 Tax=Aromatoleum sp. TaxID=2307007 RepID=UPI002B494006|nr:hypothetical protein [Aromatoleum sp.]HJV26718.1 hypothetical protein [Aromatoleum sp.]